MADITRGLVFRQLRGTPTAHVLHYRRGRLRHDGTGLAFRFRAVTSVLSEVPVDDRELPLLFRARTRDFQDVTVQSSVTYRITDPRTAAHRLDFSIDPVGGAWRGTPLDQIAGSLTEIAQQPALDALAAVPLTAAVTTALVPVRERVAAALTGDPRLAEIGVAIVSVRVVAIRPDADLDRALQTPTREAVQAEADRATYERRAVAVQRERAISENELQNRIELARREEQLVAQEGANARLRAEEAATADRVQVEQEAAREQTLGIARAEARRTAGAVEAEVLRARLDAHAATPLETLHAMALRDLAGALPKVAQLVVTPELLTGALAQLAGGGSAAGGALVASGTARDHR